MNLTFEPRARTKPWPIRLLTVAALAVLSWPLAMASAADAIYVQSDGSDERTGRSPLEAVGTIQHALSIATDGATVIAGAGNYSESLKLSPALAAKGITLFADNDGRRTGKSGPVRI